MIYIHISHKKKIRETSEETRVPIDQGDSARNSGELSEETATKESRSTDVAEGDRQLFLYKRDDNQARLNWIS